MPVTNVSQITSTLNVLQLTEAIPLPPTSVIHTTTSARYPRQSPMDTSATVLGKQGNQNAAALSPEEGIGRPREYMKYPIVQENGQRRYGPPPNWRSDPPPRGCEVFIGKIPRDCTEEELIPIFEQIGPIYMFRLMMEFNGMNRGYGFCVYTNREHTKCAVQKLDNYEIRKGKTIGVCLSVDNCRLFVGGIPKNKTREEIMVEMKRVTDGVKDVISYPSIVDKSKNRGFAFVEYESHKAAAMARRKLMPGRIQLWNQQIAVDWAEPEREVNEDIMSKVKILYVRNLMLSTAEDTLREHFVRAAGGDPNCVERVKKISDYAFIHFKEREVAARCMELLNETMIDGSKIEVTWAKPVDKSESNGRQPVNHSAKLLNELTFGKEVRPNNSLLLDPRLAAANSLLPQVDPTFSFLLSPLGQQAVTPDLLGINPSITGNPATALALGTNGCSRLGAGRIGRRNAAGSRGAGMMRDRKHPVEVLEEQCRIAGWGIPNFTILPADFVDTVTGAKIQLFIGQVLLPNLRLQFQAPRYYATPEEAKIGVSELAISNLQFNQLLSLESNANGIPGDGTSTSVLLGAGISAIHNAATQPKVPAPLSTLEAINENRCAPGATSNPTLLQYPASSDSHATSTSICPTMTRISHSNDPAEGSTKTGPVTLLTTQEGVTAGASKPTSTIASYHENKIVAKLDYNNCDTAVNMSAIRDVQSRTLPGPNQTQHMAFGAQSCHSITSVPFHPTSSQTYRPYLEPHFIAIPATCPVVDPLASNYALALGSNMASAGTAFLPWQLTTNGQSTNNAIGLLQTQPLITTPNQTGSLCSSEEGAANLGLPGFEYSASFIPNPFATTNLIGSFANQPAYLVDPNSISPIQANAMIGGSATGFNGLPSNLSIARAAGNCPNDLIPNVSAIQSVTMSTNPATQSGLYNIGLPNSALSTHVNKVPQVGNNYNQFVGVLPSAHPATLAQPAVNANAALASASSLGSQKSLNCLPVQTPVQLS